MFYSVLQIGKWYERDEKLEQSKGDRWRGDQGGMWAAIFNKVVRVGLLEKVTPEQSPEGGESW